MFSIPKSIRKKQIIMNINDHISQLQLIGNINMYK